MVDGNIFTDVEFRGGDIEEARTESFRENENQ